MESGKEGTTTTCEITETDLVVDRNSVINRYVWLVECIARSIAESVPQNVDVEDLLSAGKMGLIKAVDDFDPSRNAKLETYARIRIKGEILDELRRLDPLPYSTRSKLKQIQRAVEELEGSLGRSPSPSEIAEELGLTTQEISFLLATANSADLYSLDEIIEEGRGNLNPELANLAVPPSDPLARLERKELEKLLVDAIKELPRNERVLLGLYYYEELRMRDIGEVLGISESRVSQIHSKAILTLRAKLKTEVTG
jgi:RNA polymerase sigma factor for flagellar operon FliA